jgi:hypothetical protein
MSNEINSIRDRGSGGSSQQQSMAEKKKKLEGKVLPVPNMTRDVFVHEENGSNAATGYGNDPKLRQMMLNNQRQRSTS